MLFRPLSHHTLSLKSVLQTSLRYKSKSKYKVPYPTMAAINDSEIISRLSKLSISHPEVIQHGPVSGINDWRAELEKIGKGNVALTKTVRDGLLFPSSSKTPSPEALAGLSGISDLNLARDSVSALRIVNVPPKQANFQLLFKPKTAKSAAPTPVLVLAHESTETPSGPLGAHLKLKELRLASEDLIKEVIPSAASKDDVSALPLPTPVPSTLHLLLDAALASSADEHAIHLTSSSSTIFLKGTDIKQYLESLVQGREGDGVQIVDFKEIKANAPAPPPKKEAAA